MQVRFLRFGEAMRLLEVPEKVTVAEVLALAGEDPSDLAGYRVGIAGEAGEVRLSRPVKSEETILVVPEVKGG